MSTTLSIASWHNEYLMPRTHVAPHALRDTLDGMFSRVAGELARGITATIAGLGDAVVLVRRVQFDCAIDASCDKDSAARQWALRFARALVATIDRGDGDVVRFATMAAYRARFVADLAAGRAWDTWLYRHFDGLRALPTSAALRTALIEAPADTGATLAALDDLAWHAVARALGAHAAQRVVAVLSSVAGDDDQTTIESPTERSASIRAALATLLARDADRNRNEADDAIVTLGIVREMARQGHPVTPSSTRDAHVLAWLVTQFDANDIAAASAALRHSGLALIARARRRPSPGVAAVLVSASSMQRNALADAWQGARVATARARIPHDVSSTPFGGLAPLLVEIDELIDASTCDTLPANDKTTPRDLVALQVLALAAGADNAQRVMRDPFWRAFLNLPPRHDDAWLADASADAAEAALDRQLARHVRGRLVASRDREVAALLALSSRPDRDALLAIDTATSLWIRAHHEAVPDVSSSTTAPIEWRTRLRLARTARTDARALAAAAQALAVPQAWRAFFIRLAQAALRRCAYRIRGLAGSSIAYLHANVLGVSGVATIDAQQRTVLRLARPPLHVLLRLSVGARREVPWRREHGDDATLVIEYAA